MLYVGTLIGTSLGTNVSFSIGGGWDKTHSAASWESGGSSPGRGPWSWPAGAQSVTVTGKERGKERARPGKVGRGEDPVAPAVFGCVFPTTKCPLMPGTGFWF